MLAVGCKAGIVWLWRYCIPTQYSPSGSAAPQAFSLVCTASTAPEKVIKKCSEDALILQHNEMLNALLAVSSAQPNLQPCAALIAYSVCNRSKRCLPFISAAKAWPQPDGSQSFQAASLLCCEKLIFATVFQILSLGLPLLQHGCSNALTKAPYKQQVCPAAHLAADICHDYPDLVFQVGGFKAQRSWVTALSWAAMPSVASSSSSLPPPSSYPEQHHHNQLQQQDQLLLITGSSDGCLRLHSQSVQSLGAATVQSAGGLVEGELMQLRKTLHEADLLGVTCLAVKLREAPSSGQLPPGSDLTRPGRSC